MHGLCLLLLVAAAEGERPRLVVTELAARGDVPAEIASALTQAITSSLASRGFFDVVAAADLQAMIGVERQKQLLGCSEDSTACVSELAGALNARFVLSGQVTRVGALYQLDLQMIDSSRAKAVGRATRLAESVDALRKQVPFAASEAAAIPAPATRSRVWPALLTGGGAAVLVAGAVIGFITLQRETEVNAELSLGEKTPQVLKPYGEYTRQAGALSTQRTLSLVLLAAGAAATAAGIVFLLRAGDAIETVAFGTTGNGLFIAGAF